MPWSDEIDFQPPRKRKLRGENCPNCCCAVCTLFKSACLFRHANFLRTAFNQHLSSIIWKNKINEGKWPHTSSSRTNATVASLPLASLHDMLILRCGSGWQAVFRTKAVATKAQHQWHLEPYAFLTVRASLSATFIHVRKYKWRPRLAAGLWVSS